MQPTRRAFMTTATVALTAAAAPPAFTQWRASERYPDPAVEALDPSFAKYRLALAGVERLATGMRWSEGPAWFGAGHEGCSAERPCCGSLWSRPVAPRSCCA